MARINFIIGYIGCIGSSTERYLSHYTFDHHRWQMEKTSQAT
jgi:hypothetical protein